MRVLGFRFRLYGLGFRISEDMWVEGFKVWSLGGNWFSLVLSPRNKSTTPEPNLNALETKS